MKTCKLHLIRHGLTTANFTGVYAGSGTDLPLCEEGAAQLEALKGSYPYPNVGLVLTSPLLRCRQTADILFPGVRQIAIEDLREISFGEFEGKSAAELQDNPAFRDWLDPEKQAVVPGAESGADFAKRATAALLHICEFALKSDIREIAVITHGGLIMTALAMYALPEREPSLWACDPGCGYTVQTSAANFMQQIVEATNIVPYGYCEEAVPEEESADFKDED